MLLQLSLMIYIYLGLIICFVGIFGILINKRSMIITLISIELMLYGLDFMAIIASLEVDEIAGQIFALFILTVAAAESAISLAIIMLYYRLHGNILIDLNFNNIIN